MYHRKSSSENHRTAIWTEVSISRPLDPLAHLEVLEALQGVVGAANGMQEYSTAFLADDDDDELIPELMEIEKEAEADSDECALRHGGSRAGKAPNKQREFDGSVYRLRKHYFGVDGAPPVYDETEFSRRLGIPLSVFDTVYAALSVRPEF